MRFVALFVLFLAIDLLVLMADAISIGINGPMQLPGQATPLIWLAWVLQPWLLAVFPALSHIVPPFGSPAAVPFNFCGVWLPAVVIVAAVSAGSCCAIWHVFARFQWFRRLARSVPACAPIVVYGVLLCGYVGMCVYVALAVARYAHPAAVG